MWFTLNIVLMISFGIVNTVITVHSVPEHCPDCPLSPWKRPTEFREFNESMDFYSWEIYL